jgi:signal transduction histidine kinase
MESSSPPPKRVRIPERVFISYSRKDAEWLDRLRAQLALLIDSGTVDLWYDTGEIEPGDIFNRSIEEAIDTSSAAVLLVSADFQASDFIKKNELPRLLRRADAGELRLFWVPVGHCPLADKLGETYHTVGHPSRPLETCDRGEVNKVLADLARKLEQHVTDIHQQAEAAAKAERDRIAREEAERKRKEAEGSGSGQGAGRGRTAEGGGGADADCSGRSGTKAAGS